MVTGITLAGLVFLIIGIIVATKPKKFVFLYGFPWNLILKRKFPGPFGTSRENLPTLYRLMGIAMVIIGLVLFFNSY